MLRGDALPETDVAVAPDRKVPAAWAQRMDKLGGSLYCSKSGARSRKVGTGFRIRSCAEKRAPVAQLDRAPDFESGGQGFESLPARQSTL